MGKINSLPSQSLQSINAETNKHRNRLKNDIFLWGTGTGWTIKQSDVTQWEMGFWDCCVQDTVGRARVAGAESKRGWRARVEPHGPFTEFICVMS